MQNRARQFLPFDALKGFKEALHIAEQEVEEKKILSDDFKEILDKKIRKLKIGDNVFIKHYSGIEYIETIGLVKKIDVVSHYIYLNHSKILFDDIIQVELC